MTSRKFQQNSTGSLDPFTHSFLHTNKFLPRPQLLQYVQRNIDDHLFIQAQAGQGKTTFAMQLLDHIGARHIWHTLRSADNDSVRLFATLYESLTQALPGAGSPTVERMLRTGSVMPGEESSLVPTLYQALPPKLHRDIYLVFDDVHMVEASPPCLDLLTALLSEAPPGVRLLLLSRHPILTDHRSLLTKHSILELTNHDLALSRTEVAEFFSSVLECPLTSGNIQAVHKATKGWIMGLHMIGHTLSECRDGQDVASLVLKSEHLDQAGVLEFFQTQVFLGLPDRTRQALMRLALLEEIPLDLAREVIEETDGAALLKELAANNFFVSPQDRLSSGYVLHHLFQAFLVEQAKEGLARKEHQEVLCTAAHFYAGRDQEEVAVRYLLDAGRFDLAQDMLAGVGTKLLGANRIATLKTTLDRLPKEMVLGHPWLAYFNGVICMESAPPQALAHLEAARRGFAKTGETLGELLACTFLVYHFIAVQGFPNRGRPHLERAEKLFRRLDADLDPVLKLQTANTIGVGFCFFDADMAKGDEFLTIAERLALELDQPNFLAGVLVSRGYQACFHGNWPACRRVIERGFPLMDSVEVSLLYRIHLRFLALNLLEMEGDFANYEEQRELLRQITGRDVMLQTVLQEFITIWDVDVAIARGDLKQASGMIDAALCMSDPVANPHMHSQYLHYKAYALALSGEADQASNACQEAWALRQQAGGRLFFQYCHLFLGGALARLSRAPEAETHLTAASEDFSDLEINDARAAALAHRAWLRLKQGRQGDGLDDLKSCLAQLKLHGYVHFFSWTPSLMEPLLTEAVRQGIEADYARRLAKERLGKAVLDDGTLLPLLEIRTLGRLELVLEDRVVANADDLTPIQRQLLAQVVSAPSLSVSQEIVQEALWPDSSPDKSRAAFDTTLSRLRKSLDTLFGSIPSRTYLTLQKGVLSLHNVRVDAHAFKHLCHKGLKHVDHEERWQAGNALYPAFKLWNGEFLPGIGGEGEHNLIREELNRLFIEAAQAWATILLLRRRKDEAERVLRLGLRLDPIHDDLNRSLYNLHAANGDTRLADKVISSYRQALEKEGFSLSEVDRVLEEFWR